MGRDRIGEVSGMSHILVGAAGLSQRQIDAVPLDGAVLRGVWSKVLARLQRRRP